MKISLILKGILLYITAILSTLFICGVDDIYDKGYFFIGITLITILIYICYKTINEDELKKLLWNDGSNNDVI